MSTETDHSLEINASKSTANSLPAHENTLLMREANSTSRQHRLREHFRLIGFFFVMFLSAEVVLVMSAVIPSLFSLPFMINACRNSTSTFPQKSYDEELNSYMATAIFLNVIEIVNCCFFLRIVAKSPSFVGSSRVFKDLCRLRNFWTLNLFFLLYLMGASYSIYRANEWYKFCYITKSTFGKKVLQMNLQTLNFFSMMILVFFLNHTKLCYKIPRRAYILLKGALIVFWFRFFVMVVANMIMISSSLDCVANGRKMYFQNIITEFLFLPLCKKIIELLWEKIFSDEKCIIGKIRKNRGISQITFVV